MCPAGFEENFHISYNESEIHLERNTSDQLGLLASLNTHGVFNEPLGPRILFDIPIGILSCQKAEPNCIVHACSIKHSFSKTHSERYMISILGKLWESAGVSPVYAFTI